MSEAFGLRLKWLGCACFELDFGGTAIVSDPWITPNIRTELTWENVEACDYITLSHGHYDHTLDIPPLAKKFASCILCGENTALPLMKWANLNPMQVLAMYPNLELDLECIKIKTLPGRHSPLPGTFSQRQEKWTEHPVNDGDRNLIELGILGDFEYRNYLFTMPNGTKLLLWGNSLTYPEQRSTLRSIQPDIAILQVTARTDPKQMAEICREMNCKVFIPHHIDFPGDYTDVVTVLQRQMAEMLPRVRFILPKYGQWICL